MIQWFKWNWHDAIPGEDPDWIFYEVDLPRDVVIRMIELYRDGTTLRNSIALAEREGPDQRPVEHRSLVHGAFLKGPDQQDWANGLVIIPEDVFNRHWEKAKDVPST